MWNGNKIKARIFAFIQCTAPAIFSNSGFNTVPTKAIWFCSILGITTQPLLQAAGISYLARHLSPLKNKLSESEKWSARVILHFLYKLNFEELNRLKIKKSDKTFGKLCLHKIVLFEPDRISWIFRAAGIIFSQIAEGRNFHTLVSASSTPSLFSKSSVKSFHAVGYRDVTPHSSFPSKFFKFKENIIFSDDTGLFPTGANQLLAE